VSNMSAFNKTRARLKVRSLANTWRRRANDKALPGLRPFLPRLLREEMLDMAQWCVVSWLAGVLSTCTFGLPPKHSQIFCALTCLHQTSCLQHGHLPCVHHQGTGHALTSACLLPTYLILRCRYTTKGADEGDLAAEHRSNRALYEPRKALLPSRSTFSGALMVADITGFTKLTEALSKKGSTGVELLTNCINDYFGKVWSLRGCSCLVSSKYPICTAHLLKPYEPQSNWHVRVAACARHQEY
jgi:hypothetical protein